MGVTFLMGCFLGILVFIAIYGSRVVNVTNTDWLLNSDQTEGLWDLTQHYLGWVYYRRSPWRFPFGLLEGLYSHPISVAYTDSIPLFAVFFKLLSPILPENFQYFGLFGLLCYALMGGFGSLITYKRYPNPVVNLLGAAFFLLSPVLLKRMFYHTALSAHFLIPAAFCLWLYRDAIARRAHYITLWSILITAAALINPYLAPMTLGILLCSLLQESIARHAFLQLFPSAVIPCLCMFLFSYAIGIFYGEVPSSAEGLEELSFNLLAFINPANYLLDIQNYHYLWKIQNYSTLLPALPAVSPWQSEGFAYLGMGMIVLLLLTGAGLFFNKILPLRQKSCRKPENAADASRERHSYIISVSLCGLVFLFLALSPKATLAAQELYHIRYPAAIHDILSVFRSTGRLIWPFYYGILTLGLIGLTHLCSIIDTQRAVPKKRSGRILILLLPLLLALQIVDIFPALSYKHQAYTTPIVEDTYPFVDPAWDILGESADNIMFYTPTHYGLYCNPKLSCLFEKLGLKYGLTFNITYMSRDLCSFADEATLAHFDERKTGKRFPETIYVFFDISEIPPASETGLNYYMIDGYFIGTELIL